MEFQSIGRRRASLGSPQQAYTGIDKVRAEFNAQNQAAERVQDMVRKNQKRLIENAKTKGENQIQDLKTMESLGKFSQTLAKQLIGYQEGVNQREKERGAAKYWDNPPTPEEEAKLDEQEAELTAAKRANTVASAKYLADGGAPDIAARMRDLSGWQKVGFVEEMLKTGGSDFSSFIAQNANTPVQVGSETMTLNGTTDRVAKDYILRALRETYEAQYAGINPLYINRYLYPGMKKAVELYNTQWSKKLNAKLLEQQTLDIRNSIKGDLVGGTYQDILTQIDDLAVVHGNKKAMEMVAEQMQALYDADIIKADTFNSALDATLKGRKGKLKLTDWVPFGKLKSYIDEQSKLKLQNAQTQRTLKKKQENINFEDYLAEVGDELNWDNLSITDRQQVITEYKQKRGITYTTDSMKNALNRLSDEEEMRDLQLRQIALDPGARITASMVGNNLVLREKYADRIAASNRAVKAGEGARTLMQSKVAAAIKKSTGEESRNDEDVLEYTDIVLNDYQALFLKYFQETGDEAGAKDLALREIERKLGTPGEFFTTSEYRPEIRLAGFSETEAMRNMDKAQSFIQKSAAAGQNPFSVGIIPGTEDSYNEMVTRVSKGESFIPGQYIALAQTQPKRTPMDIALQQLKANNPEISWPGGGLAMTQLQSNLPENWQVYLSPKYIQPVTVLRTGVALQAAAIVGEDNPLLQLIRSGEGTWDSANRGTAGDTPGGVEGLEEMTLGQWKRLGWEQGGQYNALGAYQFIPPTLRGAANRLGITDSTVMTPEIQNRLAMELILGGQKRPALSAYLNGTSDDLEAALAGLSLEWAAVANASGRSSYEGQAGNAASISAGSARQILMELRRQLQESPYNQPENLTPGLK